MTNETIISLFTALGITESTPSHALAQLAATDSKYLRDLKLNVLSTLQSKHLTPKEAYIIALSVAINQQCAPLIPAMEAKAAENSTTPEEIAEVYACTSLMNANNVLYRFRHFMHGNTYYDKTSAGLRMSIMMTPALGKQLFELLSLVVSALNGCEQCVTSHEASVKQHGASEAKIFDAIRLASALKSLCVLL